MYVYIFTLYASYHTTHTTKAEPRTQEQPRRRRRRRVARRPKDASKEKTRPPPVSGGSFCFLVVVGCKIP